MTLQDTNTSVDVSRPDREALPVRSDRRDHSLAEHHAEQYRLIHRVLSHITDFAYTFDLEGRFTFINKPLLDLWGLTLEQAVGKNFFDLKYPDDLAAKLQRQIRQVIDTRERLVDETPYTSPTGAGGYYQYIFSPVISPDGIVEAVAGSTRDITDLKRLQHDRETLTRAVLGERAKLAAIVKQAPAFIASLTGPDHIFELANERYYQMIGRRDIIGKTVREALPEVEGQGFFEVLDNVYRTGETFSGHEMPVLLARDDGKCLELRYVNFVYQPLRDADGKIAGVFVHGLDVTDMIRSREALRERESAFRHLADAMPQIVWAANPDGTLDYYNRRWFEYVNLPPDDNDAARWDRFIHPDDLARAYEGWSAAIKSEQTYSIEFRVRRADGLYRWFLVRALPSKDENNNVVRWYGTCTDITDKRRLADERERLLHAERDARAEAEAANRAKDRFLAVLSHELRTPLSPVVMTIPALEIDPQMPFKFREDLSMMRRNIDLEVKLIDDLLDLSRVTSGKLRLQMQSVRAHEVLRHAIHSSFSDVSGKNLQIRHEFLAANDRLAADPARLQQVFWNLLRNAVKFTPDGGSITVRTSNDAAGHLLVEITDTGVGIPPEMLPRIFDAFEQGDARVTRQFGGLGLGLAIAKAVVEMHGGTISAASAGPNTGATFIVELDMAARPATSQDGSPGAALVKQPAPRTARVLLVEDHPDTAHVIARILNGSGFEVRTANSVAVALTLAAAEGFDVVISDIGLPDASGYDLMLQLRKRGNIKGIALSGYGMEEDVRKSREAGFSEHLVKPVNIAQLVAMLRRVIDSP